MQLPLYQCHKQVRACKIGRVHVCRETTDERLTYIITPEDVRLMPIEVSKDYYQKHVPKAGGYYVIYPDGYESFSPANVFEAGYSLILEDDKNFPSDKPLCAAVMPCGALASNVYEAYDAGLNAGKNKKRKETEADDSEDTQILNPA